MAGGLVPQAIVLAFGSVALGGADALRLLRQFAGRSAAVDLATCVVVISLLSAPLLGNMLLARFVRKSRPGLAAPATDLFAQVTATVSIGAALLVTACLLVVPGGAVRLPNDFAVENPIVVTVLAICSAFAAAVHLRARLFRGAGGSAGGPAAAPAPAPATKIKVVVFLFLVTMSSVVASFVAPGGLDAHAHLPVPEFIRRMVTMPVGAAIVTVAGTMLLVRCSRRARNTAGAGGGDAAAPAPTS